MSEWTTVTDAKATLGEGPIWYREKLYWVDIEEKRIYIYDPTTGRQRMIQCDHMVGAVVPRSQGGLAVALDTGFAFVNEETGQVTPVSDPEKDQPATRFNDGKCDPAGRFWAGTMGFNGEPGLGSLYMLDVDGHVHTKIRPVTISNGLCWSADAQTMYYIDTPTQHVAAFDYDQATGQIDNKRTAIEIDRSEGSPDGMTIDAQGNLWIALWGGGAVVCHDSTTGERLHKIELPARQITACAFGGSNLEDLYITSARTRLSAAELEKQPLAGSLFHAQVGVRGVPAYAYAG